MMIRLVRATGELRKKEDTAIPNLLSANICKEENMGSLEKGEEQPDKGIPNREKSQLYLRLSFWLDTWDTNFISDNNINI